MSKTTQFMQSTYMVKTYENKLENIPGKNRFEIGCNRDRIMRTINKHKEILEEISVAEYMVETYKKKLENIPGNSVFEIRCNRERIISKIEKFEKLLNDW